MAYSQDRKAEEVRPSRSRRCTEMRTDAATAPPQTAKLEDRRKAIEKEKRKAALKQNL